MPEFVKRRGRPEPNSIPERLQIFRTEVRFYREIAPVAGVRVPACYRAEASESGTELVLEDLSHWRRGADPVAVAGELARLHHRWAGVAAERWPWLRPVGAAADLVGAHFDRAWPRLAARDDLPASVRAAGARFVGRVAEFESVDGGQPRTLIHGDCAMPNLRTGPRGEIAYLDWEDVGAAPGVNDLARLLVSSVVPERWDEVIRAYGTENGLAGVLPGAVVQELFFVGDQADGSDEAGVALRRIEAALVAL